jgi:ABC-type multidrug transport system fused ATPase/permease subunit
MEILTDYLIFLLKVFTIALAITIPFLIVIGTSKSKNQTRGKLSITNLSDKFEEMGNAVKGSVMNQKELKKFNKETSKEKKKKDKKRRAEISKAEEDTINRMIAQKPKLNTPVEEPTVNENDNAEVDENQGLESPKTPDYYPDDDRDIPESPGTPDDPELMASPQNITPPPQQTFENY